MRLAASLTQLSAVLLALRLGVALHRCCTIYGWTRVAILTDRSELQSIRDQGLCSALTRPLWRVLGVLGLVVHLNNPPLIWSIHHLSLLLGLLLLEHHL